MAWNSTYWKVEASSPRTQALKKKDVPEGPETERLSISCTSLCFVYSLDQRHTRNINYCSTTKRDG